MGCEECGEIFCGNTRCTICGSIRVFDEELANELLEEEEDEEDEEDSDYFESEGSCVMDEECDQYLNSKAYR